MSLNPIEAPRIQLGGPAPDFEAKTTHGARPPDSALPKAPEGLHPAKQPDNGRPSGDPKAPSLQEMRKKH